MPSCDNDDNMNDPEFYVDLAAALEANESTLGTDGKPVSSNTTKLEIFKTGSWNTDKGRFSLTRDNFQRMISNFNNDVRPHSSTHGLPIDEEHDKKAALGWLKAPRIEANDKGGDSLVMDAEWTRIGMQKVKDGTYKFFSPEVHFEHKDPEGVLPRLRDVLMGGGVTNRPLLKGLAGIPALTASDGTSDPDNKIYLKETTTVDLTTIRAKENKDVTEEERKVLDAAKDQLTADEQTKFYPQADADAAAAKAAADKAAADKAAADEAEKKKQAAAVSASEGDAKTLTASEFAELQANAAKGLEASEKLERMTAEQEVSAMCFSEADGLKLPTDMKTEMTDLWLAASEAEKATLKKVFEKTKPMLDANDTSESGTNRTGGAENAQEMLEDKAAELQASEEGKNLSWGQALKEARRKNPDIAKEADTEIAAATPQLANR